MQPAYLNFRHYFVIWFQIIHFKIYVEPIEGSVTSYVGVFAAQLASNSLFQCDSIVRFHLIPHLTLAYKVPDYSDSGVSF